MYFNVQIIQCVLFHFCFVKSFRNSTVVNDIYWKTLEERDGSFVSKNYKGHDKFNDMTELQWITTCKSVTKELRNNEGYVDVYVDYRATSMYTGKRCTEILVWVPSIRGNVVQVACYCFIRSSVLTLDIPHEYIQYNRKVMIYPINTEILMVFEENKDQGNFYPLEIYYKKHWSIYRPADVKISSTPLPQSYGEVSNLKTILDTIFYHLDVYSRIYLNIIRRKYGLFTLCKIALQRTRYFERMISFSPKDDVLKESQEVTVVLRTANSELKVTIISAYDCSGFISNSETVIMNFKIAVGPKQDSLLVLRETNCPREIIHGKRNFRTSELICYEIVELIECLSLRYIRIYY